MDVLRGLSRLALLVAVMAVSMLAWSAAPSSAQFQTPQCSDGIDNDSDNAVDGADAGCGNGSDLDETDSPYSGIVFVTVPLPLVTLQGKVDARGTVTIKRLEVRAQRGSSVVIRCVGNSCPAKITRRRMITNSLRLGVFESRKLRAPLTLTFRIARPNELGKYVRYRLRRNDTPVRVDACLDQVTQEVRNCYAD